MEYTIGEVAKKTNLSVPTLRYYDELGLLPFVKRNKSGHRYFTDLDVRLVEMVNHLKKAGMSLSDIQAFLSLYQEGSSTLQQRCELFNDVRERIRSQVQLFHEMLDMLDYKCWYYETAAKAGSIDVPLHMTDDELPPEILELKKLLISRCVDDWFFLGKREEEYHDDLSTLADNPESET